MAYQDRQYYRDGTGRGGGGVLHWLMHGEISLFTAFGIHVKAHASMVIFLALILLFGLGGGGISSRVASITALFAVVLLHEFGHCFAARWTGGSADQIMLTPLGGLAMAMARRTPFSQFITVAGGPAVNVIICLVCGAGLFALTGVWPLGPWRIVGNLLSPTGWGDAILWLGWIYAVSWALLVFNMLPIYPLDGGQLLQATLWKPFGYYKSMLWTVTIGVGGGALLIVAGLTGFIFGGLMVSFIGLYCLLNSLNMRRYLLAHGAWDLEPEDATDYSAAYDNSIGRPKVKSKRAVDRAAKKVQSQESDERVEQEKIDAILAKVSAKGMNSLTWIEKRTLKKATERQRAVEESRGNGVHR